MDQIKSRNGSKMDWEEVDRHFADLIHRLEVQSSPELLMAAALLSKAVREGHTCLNMAEAGGKSYSDYGEGKANQYVVMPQGSEWCRELVRASVVGTAEEGSCRIYKPLILDAGGRLYLLRYWRYEQKVAERLHHAVSRQLDAMPSDIISAALRRLFPGAGEDRESDDQMTAILVGILRPVAVITGGPGTGKTWTAARLLALFLELNPALPLRIALTAPTAKAAIRLREAIIAEKGNLKQGMNIWDRMPKECFTLHRLLGYSSRSYSGRFNRDNPLPYDMVVVDEASMVDLPLMAALLDALPSTARLILLGDQDQLASVEPGRVFGDLCGGRRQNLFSAAFRSRLQEIRCQGTDDVQQPSAGRPMDDSIVVLHKNRRFGPHSGIGSLSRAIQDGQAEKAWEILASGQFPDLQWRTIGGNETLEHLMTAQVVERFKTIFDAETPEDCFRRLLGFRILCAFRKGSWGVESVNDLLEHLFKKNGWASPSAIWYPGRPIMVTVNDYSVRLFNGDSGVCFRVEDLTPSPGVYPYRIFFPQEGGIARKFMPSRLPPYETAYALTVHKSQGSEFDHVLLLLPGESSEIMTRELLYTAVTRARKGLEIWGDKEVFLEAARRKAHRNSALAEYLWRAGPEGT